MEVVELHRFRSGLTAAVPDGWFARESIQLAATDQNAFVVASVDFLPPEMTVDQFAAQYEQQLREQLPSYEELAVDTVQLPTGPSALLRKVRWSPPEGQPITELQMYVVHNGRGIVSTAQARHDSFDQLEPQLRELLGSIGFNGAAPAGGVLRRDDSPVSRTYEAFETGQLATTAARAFGLEATNGSEEVTPDEAAAAWGEVRSSWQQLREEL